jgi:hypothetical protein
MIARIEISGGFRNFKKGGRGSSESAKYQTVVKSGGGGIHAPLTFCGKGTKQKRRFYIYSNFVTDLEKNSILN